MKLIDVQKKITDPTEEAATYCGKPPKREDVDLIYTDKEDLKVTCEGRTILYLARKAMDPELTGRFYRTMDKHGGFIETNNRGKASGQKIVYRIRQDGTRSNSTITENPVESSVIGYMDRESRFNYCRETAWLQKNPQHKKLLEEYTRAAESNYKKFCPNEYAETLKYAKKTNSAFLLGDVFTTITLNRNFKTAYHKDGKNLDAGLACMSFIKIGKFSGGEFLMPNYGVGVKLNNFDLIIMNNREYHGNLPITGLCDWERVTAVFYYRKNIILCGTPEQEIERAKNYKTGDGTLQNLNELN